MVSEMSREQGNARRLFQAYWTCLTSIFGKRLRDTSKILDLRFRNVSAVLLAQMMLEDLLIRESQGRMEATYPDLPVLRFLVL